MSQIVQELKNILKDSEQGFLKNYISIRKIYKNEYGWPELDPIRYELCLCIIYGHFQAALTLTNHLVEALLKYSLIYATFIMKKDKRKGKDIVLSLVEDMEQGIQQYDDETMYNNINTAFKLGLINKTQKNRLHQIRENIRNPYSHADKSKMYGDSIVPVQGIEIKDSGISGDEESVQKIKSLPFLQGIAQVMQAKEYAIPYFKEIDILARSILKNVLEVKAV